MSHVLMKSCVTAFAIYRRSIALRLRIVQLCNGCSNSRIHHRLRVRFILLTWVAAAEICCGALNGGLCAERMVVRLTGIDLNPQAIRAAREFTPRESRIQWVTGMAQSFDAASDPVDLVISSLFTHHLHDDEIAAFLASMESVARRGWFINDLYRSRNAYRAFGILSAVMRWHPFVRHDGPVSIRRAFRQMIGRDI